MVVSVSGFMVLPFVMVGFVGRVGGRVRLSLGNMRRFCLSACWCVLVGEIQCVVGLFSWAGSGFYASNAVMGVGLE